MGGSSEYQDNNDLTFDNLYYKYSKFKDDYEFEIKVNELDNFQRDNNIIIYSKEEIENILKECIEKMVIEIENVIDEKFEQYNFIATYNKYIDDWNEVLCSIEVDGKLVEVKLTNDYVCDDSNSINSVYITLYSNGKGIFTECIERINQEYEFIGSNYAYVPVNESELCFKEVDKNKFIESIISEINKII